MSRDYTPTHHVLDRMQDVCDDNNSTYMEKRAALIAAMVTAAKRAMWDLHRGEITGEQNDMLLTAMVSFFYALEGNHQHAEAR